jgi:hypothetical protein
MTIHRRLPFLRRIYASRDRAVDRLAVMAARHAGAVAKLADVRAERDRAFAERDRALSAQEALLAEAALLRQIARREPLAAGPAASDEIARFRTKPFIVVMAIARSGSTLLQGILNAMPGCLVRGENGGFFLALARAHEALCHAKNHSASYTTPVNAWFGCEELDPDATLAAFAGIAAGQVLGSRRHEPLAAIGFKEVRWLQRDLGETSLWGYLGFIEAMFPEARFVLLTREIDEILRSAWWPSFASPALRREMLEFYAAARTAPLRARFEIDYSDLQAGGARLRQLAEFVGSSYVPEIDGVLAMRHSFDTTQMARYEQELARLRAMVAIDRRQAGGGGE